jgi:hypothetical protein
MLTPNLQRVTIALCCGFAIVLIAAWSSGLTGEICEQTKSGQEQCAVHNLASFFLLKVGKFLDDSAVVVTALATAAVAWFTWTLWKSSENMAGIARQTTDIAEKQMLIAGTQTDIQMKQHAIGRLQFLATHRPRLRVRHISINDPGNTIGLPTFFFDHGKEVRGGLVVVNVGGSNATIVETRHRIFFSKGGLPASAPYDENFQSNMLLPNQVLASGESCATPIRDTIVMERDNPGETTLRKFESEGWIIYVMGQIRYRDDGGAERFMGFCRVRQKDGRFRAVDDPDYEYED